MFIFLFLCLFIIYIWWLADRRLDGRDVPLALQSDPVSVVQGSQEGLRAAPWHWQEDQRSGLWRGWEGEVHAHWPGHGPHHGQPHPHLLLHLHWSSPVRQLGGLVCRGGVLLLLHHTHHHRVSGHTLPQSDSQCQVWRLLPRQGVWGIPGRPRGLHEDVLHCRLLYLW